MTLLLWRSPISSIVLNPVAHLQSFFFFPTIPCCSFCFHCYPLLPHVPHLSLHITTVRGVSSKTWSRLYPSSQNLSQASRLTQKSIQSSYLGLQGSAFFALSFQPRLPLLCWSLCFKHIGLLAAPSACHACPDIRALHMPFSGIFFPPNLHGLLPHFAQCYIVLLWQLYLK